MIINLSFAIFPACTIMFRWNIRICWGLWQIFDNEVAHVREILVSRPMFLCQPYPLQRPSNIKLSSFPLLLPWKAVGHPCDVITSLSWSFMTVMSKITRRRILPLGRHKSVYRIWAMLWLILLNLLYKSHHIPKPKCLLSRLAVIFAESTDVKSRMKM